MDRTLSARALRILAVVRWREGDGHSFVGAFRRLGHSVETLFEDDFLPSHWSSLPLRAVRRGLRPWHVKRLAAAVVGAARKTPPDLLFVYKGAALSAEAIHGVRALGAVALDVYPDPSVLEHGPEIPRALPHYDWIFTTKSFGPSDLERGLGIRRASFLPHGYDPEVHRPVELSEAERRRFRCEVSYVGNWYPEKQRTLEFLAARRPGLDLRIWGRRWERASGGLGRRIQGCGAFGADFARAAAGSDVSLALLTARRPGASSGDRITARTFQLPATGSFMLHERTSELLDYFREGEECACFSTPEELLEKLDFYLARPELRGRIATAGRQRALDSGYSVDDRAREVLEKLGDLGSPRT